MRFAFNKLIMMIYQSSQCYLSMFWMYTSTHTILQTLWLCKNLFEHKVRETSFLYLSKINIYCTHLWCSSSFRILTTFSSSPNFITAILPSSKYTTLSVYSTIGLAHPSQGRTLHHQYLLLMDSAYVPHNSVWIALVKYSYSICTNDLMKC